MEKFDKNNPYVSKNSKDVNPKKAVITFLIFMSFVLFFVVKCGCSGDKDDVFKPSKQLASISSQECVKEYLKSPASAEFPILSDELIKQLNDSTFIIENYVDSDNSFGAKLRSYYSCKVIFDKKGNSRCEDVKIRE